MKIKLSEYWWANLYFVFGLGVISEILLVKYLLIDCSREDLKVFISLMVILAVFFLDAALKPWKFLMTMKVCDGVFRSYLFGKLKCEVYTDKKIYYAILSCRESLCFTRKYIVVSNETFECYEKKERFGLKTDL